LLKELFDEVIIPQSVFEEVAIKGKGKVGSQQVKNANWLNIRKPEKSTLLPPYLLGLDKGEIDVLILAKEVNADWVIIDEKLGRRIAKSLGLKVKRTLGILLSLSQEATFSKRSRACYRQIST